MPGLASMLDLGSLTVGILVFSIWSLTPVSWIYVCLTVASFFVSLPTLPLLPLPTWWRSEIIHPIFLTWSIVEVVFSIIYAGLVRQVQQRGPAPMYGRRFLRRVFSRALESGMDDIDTVDKGKEESGKGSGNGVYQLRKRKNVDNEGRRPSSNPMATKRLRAASFVPRFVDKEPLHKDDPRAKAFAKVRPWGAGLKEYQLSAKESSPYGRSKQCGSLGRMCMI
jgi:hypothetical protein